MGRALSGWVGSAAALAVVAGLAGVSGTAGAAGGPAAAGTGPVAGRATGDTLPGGTAVEVAVAAPASGAAVPAGAVTVSGSATIGAGSDPAGAALVYVLDVSGSTTFPASGGCGGAGDDTLDCEITAARALNREAVAAGTIGAVGAVAFADYAAAADVSPTRGRHAVTGPATDADGDRKPDIEQVLASAVNDPGGIERFSSRGPLGFGTNFEAAVIIATRVATAAGDGSDRTIVAFMSDGYGAGNVAAALAGVPEPVDFFTFAVGSGAECGDPAVTVSLAHIAARTGGACTAVPDVSALPEVLPGVLGSQLSSLTLRVDGGDPVPIRQVTPALPRTGPATVSYTADVELRRPGRHELCVTATGTDAGGTGEVTDCRAVVVYLPGQAYAARAAGLLPLPPTPHASCPPDASLAQAGVRVAGLHLSAAAVTALHADCTVDTTTGRTVATAGVESAVLLGGLLRVGGIESSCTAGEDGVTGSSTVATVNGVAVGSGSGSLGIPLLAMVYYNQTVTGPGGKLVQTAIRVQTGLGERIELASCRIG